MKLGSTVLEVHTIADFRSYIDRKHSLGLLLTTKILSPVLVLKDSPKIEIVALKFD